MGNAACIDIDMSLAYSKDLIRFKPCIIPLVLVYYVQNKRNTTELRGLPYRSYVLLTLHIAIIQTRVLIGKEIAIASNRLHYYSSSL